MLHLVYVDWLVSKLIILTAYWLNKAHRLHTQQKTWEEQSELSVLPFSGPGIDAQKK
jgi:hypothetical protein